MLRILVLAIGAFVLYKLFTNDRKKKQSLEETDQEHKVATGELVKDPVCGTYVDSQESISVRDGDQVFRFCSYECRQKFLDTLKSQGRELPPPDSRE